MRLDTGAQEAGLRPDKEIPSMPEAPANLFMFAMLCLSALAGAGLTLAGVRPWIGRINIQARSLWLGMAGLSIVWLLFVPVNVLAHLSGDLDSWIFGAETFDGGIVETGTVAFYAGAIALVLTLASRHPGLYGRASSGLWRGLFGFAALAFGLMIGEEMSWGQHILGFGTPAELAAANLQGEANVHNLVSPRLYDLIYCGLGWSLILAPPLGAWLSPRLPKLSPLAFLSDIWRAWPAYALLASSGILLQHEVFEELSEMVLAIGLFVTLAAILEKAAPVSAPAPGVQLAASSAG